MFSSTAIFVAAGGAWIAFALACRSVDGTLSGDPVRSLALLVVRVYASIVHRLRVLGRENVPAWRVGEPSIGPLVVVANHASGADPLLIQSACGFEVRWLMMRGMMPRSLDALWKWIDVIPVEQDGRDTSAVRTALRHLKDGGVLGIFAEGGLERPPGVVMPFEPGVGLLVKKSGARVLPAVIAGAAGCDSAGWSLVCPSRSRVRFLPMRSYKGSDLDAAGITLDLEIAIADALGWPRSGRGIATG